MSIGTPWPFIQRTSASSGSRGMPHPAAKSFAVPSGTTPKTGRAAFGEIHQTVNHLVQCTVPAGGNQQICFACFRRKPPGVSFFPSHSHFDPMSGCSLLHNCVTKRVIGCHFTIENQLNFSFSRPGSHFAVWIVDLYFAVEQIWSWNDKRVRAGDQWKEVLWLIANPAA